MKKKKKKPMQNYFLLMDLYEKKFTYNDEVALYNFKYEGQLSLDVIILC